MRNRRALVSCGRQALLGLAAALLAIAVSGASASGEPPRLLRVARATPASAHASTSRSTSGTASATTLVPGTAATRARTIQTLSGIAVSRRTTSGRHARSGDGLVPARRGADDVDPPLALEHRGEALAVQADVRHDQDSGHAAPNPEASWEGGVLPQ